MEHMKDAALGQVLVLLEKCIAKGKKHWLTFILFVSDDEKNV